MKLLPGETNSQLYVDLVNGHRSDDIDIVMSMWDARLKVHR